MSDAEKLYERYKQMLGELLKWHADATACANNQSTDREVKEQIHRFSAALDKAYGILETHRSSAVLVAAWIENKRS